MEPGYPGFYTGWQTDTRFPVYRWLLQRQKKKKNISVTELGNPYTLLKRYESRETYKWCKTGEDVSKSECLPVMGKIEVYASARKGAELKQVFHGNERR